MLVRGMRETHAFALIPNDVSVIASAKSYLRPDDLRKTIAHFLASARPREMANRDLHDRSRVEVYSSAQRKSKLVSTRLRVMTYNVHACVGMDGQLSPRRIARIIAQSEVDIAALQELDVYRSRTGYQDQAKEIARYLEMEFHFHPAWDLNEERYGDAILSRLPMRLIKSGPLPLSNTKREPRGALWVQMKIDKDLSVQVVNTHLSIYPAERILQTESLIRDWICETKRFGPVIVCGDFNATPHSKSYLLLAEHLNDIQTYHPRNIPAHTWFSPRPLTRIDHIFTSEHLTVRSVDVIRSRLAQVASDHLPLVTTLALTRTDLSAANVGCQTPLSASE